MGLAGMRKITVLGALVACLVLPAGASAAFPPLTEKRALPIATKLARQVAVKREVRSWYLSRATSVRPNRVVFVYSDRNSAERFCRANLVVEQSSRVRRAFLAARKCFTIPGEALEIESATSALMRAAEGQRPDVRLSLRRFAKDVRECEGVVFPRGIHDEIDLLYDMGEALAAIDPVLTHLDAFVTRLQEIQPEDPDLLRGVVWWRRMVDAIAALPPGIKRPCTALTEWSRTDFSPSTAPFDFAALEQAREDINRYERGIVRAAAYLAELGIAPRIVPGFTPEGVIELATGEDI
jgi:hypothetical protein